MKIGEFAAAAGVSTYTLRYYEKIGLIAAVERNAAGVRVYRPADAKWIAWIDCLKTAGMTIATIKRYSTLRDVGDTAGQIALLEAHVHKLSRRIEEMQGNLAVSRRKLDALEKS